MNPEEIIDKNKQSLVEKIDVKNTLLWERLIELGLFNSGDVEQIVVSINNFRNIYLVCSKYI